MDNDRRCKLTINGDWADEHLELLHLGHNSTFNVGSVHAQGETKCANAGAIVCNGDWIMPKGKMFNCERTYCRGQFLVHGNCQLASLENIDQKERFNVCKKMFSQFASTLDNPTETHSIWAPDHEIELVRFQLWELIGRPFLPWFKPEPGQESAYEAPKDPFAPYTAEEEQLWQLYENACLERKALRAQGLGTITLGKHLTNEQRKALTRDMVWLVETKLPPWEKILTLRVFLCENTLKSIQVGPSNFVAGSFDITTTGNFTNEGLMEAIKGPLKVSAGGAILNQGGALISKEAEVNLQSKTAIINQSGTIEGKTGLNLAAPVIISETTTGKVPTSVGHHTVIGGQDFIQSAGKISLEAGKTLILKGTRVATDGDVVLKSGDLLHMGAMESSYESHFGGRRWSSVFRGKAEQPASISGHDVQIGAEGAVVLEAPQLSAQHQLAIVSEKGQVRIEPVINTEYSHSEWSSKRSLGSKARGTETGYQERVIRPHLRAHEALLESELNLDTAALDLEAKGRLQLHSRAGKVLLRSAREKAFYQQTRKRSGVVTTQVSDHGKHRETLIAPHMVYGDVQVTGKLMAEIKRGNLEPWVVDLSRAYEVDLRALSDHYAAWNYHQTQMSAPLRTFLTVGMTIVTNGWGSEWAGAHLGTGRAVSAGIGKAMEGIITASTVNLIAHGGDVNKALKELSNSEFIKGLVANALGEGIVQAQLGGKLAKDGIPDGLGDHLKRNLQEAVIRTGTSAAIEGGKVGNRALELIGGAFVDTGTQRIARDIGAHYANGTGDMGYLTHKLAHFVLGAAPTAAKGKDPIAGAVGATIGEMFISHALTKMRQEVRAELEQSDLSPEEFDILCLSTFLHKLVQEREWIEKEGRLLAAGTAWAMHFDITTADAAAKLAIEYNSFAEIDAILQAGQKALLKLCEKGIAEAKTFIQDYGDFVEPIVEFLCPPAELIKLGIKHTRGEVVTCVQLASAGFNILPIGTGLSFVAKGGQKVIAKLSLKYNSKFWSKTKTFKGVKVHQRDDLIDLAKIVDKEGRTNLQRMQKGLAPIGPDKLEINLHHMLQSPGDPLAEITSTMHMKHGKILNINPKPWGSVIDRNKFRSFKEAYWKDRALDFIKAKK